MRNFPTNGESTTAKTLAPIEFRCIIEASQQGERKMTITIKIHKQPNGKRTGLYQQTGTASKFWHCLPVRQAEKALKEGKVSIGVSVDIPVVAA